MKLYLIGSLRNPEITSVANKLEHDTGLEVFASWAAAGPEADDYWKKYEQERGKSYVEALNGYAATHVYEFDRHHLDSSIGAILVLPAGKSGHLELGYMAGCDKFTGILLDDPEESKKLPEAWHWVAGLYEGEGSFVNSNAKKSKGVTLSITMADEDMIRRVKDVTGIGNVYGPYKRTNPKWSDMYRWQVTNRKDAIYFFNTILPYLSSRRKAQVIKMFEMLEVSEEELNSIGSAWEHRFDVMYKFADTVTTEMEEMVDAVRNYTSTLPVW